MSLFNLINPLRWSLSRKFISIVLLILLIPIASVGLLKEIESTLVNSMRSNLLLSSQLIANQLSANPSWFEESLLPDSQNYSAKELFVFPLAQDFNLDGYHDDWFAYEIHRKSIEDGNNHFGLLLGSAGRHLVISIKVDDPFIQYPNANNSNKYDYFSIEFRTQKGELKQLHVSANAAGSFPVKFRKNGALKIDWRYKASWIETSKGFNLEIQFPSGIMPKQLRVTYNNVDSAGSLQTLSTSARELNPIVWPSINFVRFFGSIELPPAQRIWLLDRQGRVLASSGNLSTDDLSFSSNRFFNWVLTSDAVIEADPRVNNLHLNSIEILDALNGKASTKIETLKNANQSIAMATLPIISNGEVFGALLLEENVARVQVLQKKTLIRMFAISSFIFVLVVWAMFWYVSRLVSRIRRLNAAIDDVVDHEGRMQKPFSFKLRKGDEIDELYSAFDQMGTKLYEYNDHLEKLASRLSHELRTPIAIVSSSLDNLLLNCRDDEDKEIINRALDGNKRLGEIITRMRQASGVKDAMQTAEKELIEIDHFISQMIKGYQHSFTKHRFVFETTVEKTSKLISADLFAEMMDKLVSNAMEFCEQGSVIRINLDTIDNVLCLTISNDGPTISDSNLTRIFQSLVSVRNSQQSTGTNLGLGLYVVRLIAEFHELKVEAKNRVDGSGVMFIIRW